MSVTSKKTFIGRALLGALAVVIGLAGLPAAAVHATGPDTVISGFSTPESVLYDKQADMYLVSNINGAPLDKDDNGFISRVSPDGTITNLKWIDGASASVTLNAPKGMTIVGNRLYVADIDTVRVFDRVTGQPITSIAVPGATFLNDLASDNLGIFSTVYASDSGLDANFQPTGTDAVYKIQFNQLSPMVADPGLHSPNGVANAPLAVYMATFSSNIVYRINKFTNHIEEFTHLPTGSLDGLVRLPGGTMYVSSWEGSNVYKVDAGGTITTEVSGTPAPADIGYDSNRSRLMIPLFMDSKVQIHTLN